MDWFSWLSKTGLDPCVVHDCAVIFTQNELEEEDLAYFNHEVLQSMGISIAKHRLEILKLARKKKKHHMSSIQHPMLWLIVAIKQTKNYLAKHVQALVRREENSALAIVSKRHNSIHSSRWKVAMLKRNKRWMAAARQERSMNFANESHGVVPGQKILMLTNGSPLVESMSWNNSYASPMVHDFHNNEKNMDGVDGEYLSTHVVEDIRWDTMFQDLKPT